MNANSLTAPTIELRPPVILADAPNTGGISALAAGSMLALAALDLIGSYCALRYVATGHQVWWTAGAVAFVSLFGVYSACLRWAELSIVTIGWIVLIQVGVLAMDWLSNGFMLPTGKLVAVAIILCALTYVLFAPNHKYEPKHAGRPVPATGERVMAQRGVHA